MNPIKIEINFEPSNGRMGGFKQEWVSTDHEGVEATLYSGAGCGNQWMEFTITHKDGTTDNYMADMGKLFQELFGKANAQKS